nr:lysophospholipid acyltransferase family protein [uncultured Pseudomonas sp.]
MKKLRLYLRLLRLLAVIALGSLLAAGVSLLERLVRHDLMPTRQRLTRWFLARLSAALPFSLSVEGELPRQPMLWVSNHVSWTDIPLLGMLAPLSFLSKAEVRAWPVAGWLAQKAGTLFIRRGSGDSGLVNQQLNRHLQRGRHLLIFPEGTTTDGLALRTFHGRLLSSAIDSGVAVQPVAIRYLRDGQPCDVAPFIGDDDMLSHLLRLLGSERAQVQVQLLAPIASRDLSRNALARQAQQAVSLALFGEIALEARESQAA